MNNQTTYTLERLLKEYKVEIPAIQRDYAFGRKNQEDKLKKFVNEIKKALLSDNDKPPLHLDFIYGKKENKKLFLIDGQQRITTLWLVAVYLTKVAESYNLTSEENKIKNLDKFSYDTRTSSREFCKAILSERLFEPKSKDDEGLDIIDFDEQWFFNKKWVFNEWKYDPTIMSMFNVLKEIHKELKDFYDDFINDNDFSIKELMSKIDFSFLNVEELGNPEELYLKMNSRGKPLSDWDDFKAELFKFVDKDESIDNDFKYLVDTELVDLFWEINKEKEFENLNKKANQSEDDTSYKDVKDSPTDKGILKLFKSAVKVEIIIKKNDKNDKEIPKYDDKKHYYYSDEKANEFVDEHWADIIDLNSIQKFWEFLIKNKNEIGQIDFSRFDKPGIRINDLFKSLQGSDSENMTSNELSLFAAYYLFVKNRVNGDLTYDKDDLRQTIRIITNYQDKNERSDFNHSSQNIENINHILENKNHVLESFKKQNEESDKAKIIKDNVDKWEELIYKCEKNDISKGSAKWLFDLSEGIEENGEIYFDKIFGSVNVAPLISSEGKISDKNKLNLLSYVDIRGEGNEKFPEEKVSNSEKYSWWSFFNNLKNSKYYSEKINGLRKFLENNMQPNKNMDKNDWRQWYLEDPSLLKDYGTLKLNYYQEGTDFLLEGQKNGSGTKYLLQLEGLKRYLENLEGNQVKIETTSSSNRMAPFFGYIGEDENHYRYKITYEFPEDVKYKKSKDLPKNVTEEEHKKNEELLYTKQFVIYSKNEKDEDKEEFRGKSDSIHDKLKEVSEKLYSLTQNKL